MRRLTLAASVLVAVAAAAPARAQSTGAPTSTPTPTPLPAPTATSTGLAVVALTGATDAAWPLAQALYAEPSVRATAIDEAHARVLCGEPVAPGAPADLRDLGATVAAVHGDDAPSRAMLTEVARHFAVRGLVVVRIEGTHPTARVFLAAAEMFDAATYEPDEGSPLAWSASTRLLVRSFGAPALVVAAPLLATHVEPNIQNAPPPRRSFYESGWFWGAVAAAAFAGGAIYLATRDNGAPTIHLELQTPH
jgi:hypothetical protein